MAANAFGASQGKLNKAAIINGSAMTILADADKGGVFIVVSLFCVPDTPFGNGTISFF
jgi:hypothetical protein